MSLVLASASPRRAELLRQAGILFEVVEPGVSEDISGNVDPAQMVVELSKRKALDVSCRFEKGFVLAADTIVVCRDQVLGKPRDRDNARRMLRMLSGNEHMVFTGLALFDAATGSYETGLSKTRVWMKPLKNEHIDLYVACGEPMDKAGAYGIQGRGALFIDKIEGCYFNVVGLPLSLLFDLFIKMQVPTWFSGKDGSNEKRIYHD